MINLFGSARKPNVQKILIMLEESCIPYSIEAIDFHKDEGELKELLNISPAGVVLAIYDKETD